MLHSFAFHTWPHLRGQEKNFVLRIDVLAGEIKEAGVEKRESKDPCCASSRTLLRRLLLRVSVSPKRKQHDSTLAAGNIE